MSLITAKWAFKNSATGEIKVIAAIDGPTAWKLLGFDFNRYPTMPCPWDIYCVCTCGAIQAESFCSVECFDAWKSRPKAYSMRGLEKTRTDRDCIIDLVHTFFGATYPNASKLVERSLAHFEATGMYPNSHELRAYAIALKGKV